MSARACAPVFPVQVIIDGSKHYLTASESNEVLSTVRRGLLFYSWLSHDASQNGRLLWNFVPKHHFLIHLAMEARFFSPRLAWTYRDEDFVGRLATIANKCSFGLGPARMAPRLMEKWACLMQVRFRRRRRLFG